MTDTTQLEQQILADVAAAGDDAALETVRVAALGKSGSLTALLKMLGTLPPEERKTQGPLINGLKDRVSAALASRRDALKDAALEARLNTESVDVTLPVREAPAEIGRVHPITQVTDELTAIFADMGFAVAEGPDVETNDYNFTKLNFPEDHPARDMHDTFFFNPKPDGTRLLLRTHTSPVQVRTMLSQKPPIRVIIPGRTYRRDSDQTHTPMFHQVEGLVIDKGSHLGHLKWILEEFFKAFFEVDRVGMRFRPSFFPFTEPSLEVDLQYRRDKDEVRFGEGDQWMEILGCGMVHPNVLKNCGLDPDEYQGFAWGMGIDRLAMLKYGMPDLRAFFEADVRWLSHYGFRPLDVPTLAGGLSGGDGLARGGKNSSPNLATLASEEMTMDNKQIAELADKTLKPFLSPLGLDRVEVEPGRDHDDAPSLFVTAYYRPGSKVPEGDVLLKALGALHKAFLDVGEERFPYLDHRFAGEEEFEEGAFDGDTGAPSR
jgi:phenylalanyl-tRNA synthetase alpha chain